jgi:processing peptidase subunit alpha
MSILTGKGPAVNTDMTAPINSASSSGHFDAAPEFGAEVTTLPSGMRIVTKQSANPLVNVSVVVDVGSRHEGPHVTGITSFLERMTIKGTSNRSAFRLVRDMSKLGATVSCATSREHLVIQAEGLRNYADELTGTLADLYLHPAFAHRDITTEIAGYKLDNTNRGNMPDILINEAIHQAAYGTDGLGAPLYANNATLDAVTPEILSVWHKSFFTPSRTVVSAVGVDHKAFVGMVRELFANAPRDSADVESIPSAYVGGEVRQSDRDYNGLTHIALAWEAPSMHSEDLLAACVLQTLMGGGGSFSAGGPGKGMYSRLYQRVLAEHSAVDSTLAFQNIYTDSGLFGLYAVADPAFARQATETLCKIAVEMPTVTDVEVERAKNQVKCSFASHLERRAALAEEMARHITAFGKYDGAAFIGKIDAVNTAAVQKVAKKMLATPLSLATYGNATQVPRYDLVAAALRQ